MTELRARGPKVGRRWRLARVVEDAAQSVMVDRTVQTDRDRRVTAMLVSRRICDDLWSNLPVIVRGEVHRELGQVAQRIRWFVIDTWQRCNELARRPR